MLGGLARLFFLGFVLLAVAVTVVWSAVSALLAALVSWPGLLLVGALAAVVAVLATGGVGRSGSRPAVRRPLSRS